MSDGSINRDELLTVRVKKHIHTDFKIVAELRGATMSGLIHQYMVRLIREEKERDPEAFKRQAPPEVPVLQFEKRTATNKVRTKAKKSKNDR